MILIGAFKDGTIRRSRLILMMFSTIVLSLIPLALTMGVRNIANSMITQVGQLGQLGNYYWDFLWHNTMF